jgi:hypothetical protein
MILCVWLGVYKMKTLKVLIIAATAFVVCGAFISTLTGKQESQAKASPSDTAIYGCENWTKTNSKLAVGEIVSSYAITSRKLKPGHYMAGVDYRTSGIGLLMHAQCEYMEAGRNVVLVSAEAGLR